ncbi:hypothetical protein [Bacillus sp. 179-C3.3 HS]|uniref:hypothetical protein n=1 Tax=Bacillus sp. 179-C3.3 HS TaxID=3232162 RepID=UPI0039A0A648
MSKKKILMIITIAVVILSVTLFFLFNQNKNNLTIKTSETINTPISIVMKELGTDHTLFSSDKIENSTHNIELIKDHGEFSLVLVIHNQEQEILGYGDSSERSTPIELSINKENNTILVNSKVTTTLNKEETILKYPIKN